MVLGPSIRPSFSEDPFSACCRSFAYGFSSNRDQLLQHLTPSKTDTTGEERSSVFLGAVQYPSLGPHATAESHCGQAYSALTGSAGGF